MRSKYFLPALCCLFLLSGCAVKVRAIYDHTVDFKKYKSFCWMRGCEFNYTGPKYLQDSLIRKYFKTAITEELTSKGLVYNDDTPDLLVDLHIAVEKKSDVLFFNGADKQMVLVPLAEPLVIDFLKGTLVIDIVDRKQGKMIWRSAAVGYMDEHPEITFKKIKEGVTKVLRKFPPGKNENREAVALQNANAGKRLSAGIN